MRIKVKRKGTFERVVVFVFLILIGISVMGYAAIDFIKFKVDVQKVGQEEYDRFTLSEKILNVEECTLSRGVFLADSETGILNPDENCHFSGCEVETTVDWAYSISIDGQETKVCEVGDSQEYKPTFKISESIPVLIYYPESEEYKTAFLFIYGPDGVYSTAYTSGRTTSGILEYSEDKEYTHKVYLDYSYEFECDAPEGLTPMAKCVIEKFTGTLESNTGGGCNPCDLSAVMYVETDKKSTTTVKEARPWVWELWTAENYFSNELYAGEDVNLGIEWSYSGEAADRNFRNPQIELTYRVVCPPGMIAKRDESDNFICESLEQEEEDEEE